MKKIKATVAVLLTFLILYCFTGCCFKKERIIDTFDDIIQYVGSHVLTAASELQGKRETGIDLYTGNYSAEYDNFNGKEFIFGGTGLERDNGSNLTVTYSLKIDSGSAALLWLNTGEEQAISEESSEDTYKMTINAGSNYIVLQGNNFSGSLELSVGDR